MINQSVAPLFTGARNNAAGASTPWPGPAQQFRMTRLQVFNWGTFNGYHDIPISPKGFLFTGPSGSGKSSLLDAITALLIPSVWIDFNAAARDSEKSGKDRGFASYVRGAWGNETDTATGHMVKKVCRPGSTFSALGLTFTNGRGEVVQLMQILQVTGTKAADGDVNKTFLVVPREVGLMSLKAYAESGFTTQKLNSLFPDANAITKVFKDYSAAFCARLGIDNEAALKLLHKTQSAKNVADLNVLMRDFMLETPETFDAAKQLVSAFSALNEAHRVVVDARKQIEVLSVARNAHTQREDLLLRNHRFDAIENAIAPYTEQRRHTLLVNERIRHETEIAALESQSQQASTAVANALTTLRDLEAQHRNEGGDQIVKWEDEKTKLAMPLQNATQKHVLLSSYCQKLGLDVPADAAVFSAMSLVVRSDQAAEQTAAGAEQDLRDALVMERSESQRTLIALDREARAMSKNASGIPASLIELRDAISLSTGIPIEEMPFVGEMIEVKKDQADWRGAIERLFSGFAKSMVVSEKNSRAVAEYANGRHLGQRFDYHKAEKTAGVVARPAADSVLSKLNVGSSDFSNWLSAELAKKFDYTCVNATADLQNQQKSITREGLIRRSKSHFEKNDTHSVTDKRHWILGFDNRERLAAIMDEAASLQTRLDAVTAAIAQADSTLATRTKLSQVRTQLLTLVWADVDSTPYTKRIAELDKQLKEARKNSSKLRDIGALIEKQGMTLEQARDRVAEVNQDLKKSKADIVTTMDAITRTIALLTPLMPEMTAELSSRFALVAPAPTLAQMDRTANAVGAAVRAERSGVVALLQACETKMIVAFSQYISQWKALSGDLDATLASAPDFMARLARLQKDGLPQFEEQFFAHLRKQSDEHLAALSSCLDNAHSDIMNKMIPVNESLLTSPFNVGTNLRIDVKPRIIAEVTEFRSAMRNALKCALNTDPTQAEDQFMAMRTIVAGLGSEDPAKCRWRDLVLDVRRHVEFSAVEFDANDVVVGRFGSGEGLSGGQRQKLAATCLAAALRYRLGGVDGAMPIYAAVVMDEAFDKTDAAFTELCMNIFQTFGFQMIVATPGKALTTLEPFIGGACVVQNPERNSSSCLQLAYSDATSKLVLDPEQEMLSSLCDAFEAKYEAA
jgi:uncharacterized protein YPO0396